MAVGWVVDPDGVICPHPYGRGEAAGQDGHDTMEEPRMSTATTTLNGIDVSRLVETIEAIGADADLGSFTFRATSEWKDGTHSVGAIAGFTHAGTEDQSRAASFVLHGDEPPVLLGTNNGPNAVELLLQALSFCYAVGYVANAAAKGIEITRMEYEVEGDFDVRRFLGLEGPRPGFTVIRAKGRVSSPNATEAQLQDLCRYVQDTSPVRDCLANAVPVETTLEIV
jgi:uncharacterized OsmC-like protein